MSSKLKKWYVILGLILAGLMVCMLLLVAGGLAGAVAAYFAVQRVEGSSQPAPWGQIQPETSQPEVAPGITPQAEEDPQITPVVPETWQRIPESMLEQLSGQLWAAVIVEVDVDGSAGQAGLEAGDIIIAVDDKAMDQERDLRALIASHEPGDEVEITLVRPGDDPQLLNLEVTLGSGTTDEGDEVARLGLEYRSVSTGLGVYFRRGMPWPGEVPRTD